MVVRVAESWDPGSQDPTIYGDKIGMISFMSAPHYIINRWNGSVFHVQRRIQQGVCPVSAGVYLYTCFGGR